MNKPLLSILIPSAGHERHCQWNNLLGSIFRQSDLKRDVGISIKKGAYWMNYWQSFSEIEVISCFDNKEMTIGEKREILYKEANGLYSWQIDDDDAISPDSINIILNAIKENPDADCITFRENCMINGKYYSSNHSLKYDDWGENQDGFDYVRTPFYKDVIKTDIAKSVPFEHIRYGEDHAWARALKPHLKNEIHIDQELYFYIHNSKPEDHNERYGIV